MPGAGIEIAEFLVLHLVELVGAHRFENEGAHPRLMRPPANGDEIHLAPEFRLDQWTCNYFALRDGIFRHEAEPEARRDHGQDPVVAVATVDSLANRSALAEDGAG